MSKSQQNVPKRRPSLASPLPPTPIVPSTPLPRANIPCHQHQQQQQQLSSYQQRPSTAPSTSDPRGMMKRLMAKPAPLSSPSSAAHMLSEQNGIGTNHIEQLLPAEDDIPPPNEFYKSIRALDLVGKIDISMSPCVISTATTTTDFLDPWQCQEQDLSSSFGSVKKQRNVLRRRPSGINKNTTSILETSSNPIQILKDEGTTISSIPPTPHPTPKDYPSPTQPRLPKSKPPHKDDPIPFTINPHPPQPTKIEESATLPYYTVFGDTSGKVVAAGGPRDAFWDTFQGDWVPRDKLGDQQQSEEGGSVAATGLTRVLSRTVSGRRKKSDSDQQQQQLRSKPSVQQLRRSSDGGVIGDHNRYKHKKSPESPGGSDGAANSPSRRFWKLVKKISVGGLREKYQTDDPPPPVPPLPNDIANDPYRTIHSSLLSDCSLGQPGASRGLKKVASTSTSSVSSPTVPLGQVNNQTTSPSSTSTQHHPKILSHPPPSQPTTGPRPSTTTRSSSHSSDVASSRFFNRTQSARSSTSSFGEEVLPLPPLPISSISVTTTTTTTYCKTNETNTDDDSVSRKLQQHIIPPSELIRNLSTSNFPTTPSATTTKNSTSSTMPISIPSYSPPSTEDDWTIVRSPSVELEALSLPPPPRRLGMGLKGVGVVESDHKGIVARVGGGRSKVGVIPASKMLKMVNRSSEKVDEREEKRDQDVPRPSPTPSYKGKEEEEEELTATKPEQEDKVWAWKQQSHSDAESDRPPSPIIPSFSTSSAINSFPARRVSSSASRNRGSPNGVSPVSSNDRNGGSGGLSSTANGSISPSSQRSGSPQRSESRSAFGRVRQHLFGINDVRVKAEEDEEDDEFLNPLPLSRKSEIQIARLGQLYAHSPQPQHQQQTQAKYRKHHRHSSGSTNTISTTTTSTTSTGISKSRSAHATPASSTSRSPIITFHPHRRSISFNTPSSAPSTPSPGLFSSARSPSPFLSSLLPPHPSRLPEPFPSPPPPPAVSPSLMTSLAPPPSLPTNHRTRSSSNLRAGFSSKKISEVLFSSSSPSAAASPPPPALASTPPTSISRKRPSSISGHRTFMNRSISVGAAAAANHPNNSNNAPSTTTITTLLSQPRPALTDQEKADKWNDLLDRSARAGGTLHLAAGSRLLGSDDDDHD